MKALVSLLAVMMFACSNNNTSAPTTQSVTVTPGLVCDVYNVLPTDETGIVNWAKMFTDATFFTTVTVANINAPNELDTNPFLGLNATQQTQLGYTNFAYNCEGNISIPVTGQYGFAMFSDDGSELVIDGEVILNMPQLQTYNAASNANVNLTAGLHKISVLYFQGQPSNVGWTLMYQGPANEVLAVIPASAFSQ